MTSVTSPDLWTLALQRQWIDPAELADALQREAEKSPLDFRTRLLIRDSLSALEKTWGQERLRQWLLDSPCREVFDEVLGESLGPPGFSLLTHAIMETTKPETVLQFLRELGQTLSESATICVGGSTALILNDLLSRQTEDIDVVDELPVQIRSQHDLLDSLAKRYRLRLTHFQSHFLPTGWESRLYALGVFGRLDVRLVDSRDIFLSKLFSNRIKDRDDLRALARQIDKPSVLQLLPQAMASLGKESALGEQAEKNWYVLYGEQLPG